tara:strand:+ start:3380 stop:4561 length:1182 start_codon:yes stop_codon:yes gene_type:complete
MKCKICGSANISQVIDLGKQPFANKYPRNKFEIFKEKKFNLKIFFCKRCKASQIKRIVNRKILFEDYYYLSSVNKKLKEHFENLSYKLKKYNFVVDIGSNDGILLEPLKKLKISSIGIDPSKNVGKIANDRGLKTFIGFFDNRMIKKILKEYQKPDLIVASSVVTHLKNPILFSKNIKEFIKKNGTLIIEIEYLQNFLKNVEYERFYFDRPFYYSANSVKELFKNVQMKLYDIERIDVHGGSLRFYIKNSLDCKITKRCEKILNNEKQTLNLNTFKLFNKKIYQHSKYLKDQLIRFKRHNKIVIGYGCPARVSTITNFSKINSDLIKYIIDDSPLKQNRFTPGMHIKILPRKNNLSNINVVMVFAYEYFKDIKKIFKNKKVIFFKPIPFIKLL